MGDIEKAIKGLKCCAEDVNEFGDCLSNDCPYKHKQACCSHMARDALELLKSQQPRVLTLEEVKASNGKDLILEYGQWGCEDNIVTAVTIEGCGSKGVSFALSVVCDYATYNRKHSFGWRCWNVRPTDEQREGTPWNCRLATKQEQNHNKRNNVVLMIDGKRYTVTQAAIKAGVKPSRVFNWLYRGVSKEEAIRRLKAVKWDD